ncbi:MAG: type I restriction enzyme HsdR N-terminal domain-containing protein [Bacteroidota bacterium]
MLLDVDFSQHQPQLQVRRLAGKRHIFGAIRKKYLVLSPEEMVRQLIIAHLIETKGYKKQRISVEKSLLVNGLRRRFDILVYQKAMQPFLLVECKAPSVPIDQGTFEQIARYNMTLKVPYLLVSNGHQTYCCEIDFEQHRFHFLESIPDYPAS